MTNNKLKSVLNFFFILSFVFTVTMNATAQEKEGKKKVHLKTVKVINGKKVVTDTTFYVNEDEKNISWTTKEGNVIKGDSLMEITIDMEVDSDGKGKQKKMIFISEDGNMEEIHLDGDSLHEKHKVIIKSIGDDHSDESHDSFFISDNAHKKHASHFNKIKVESIDKIEITIEVDEKTKKEIKIIKVSVRNSDGKVEEKIIKESLMWSNAADKKHTKMLKKDVEVTEENGVKIIKIKTTDQDGNENIEIKKIKTDGSKKEIIIISEDGEHKESVNVDVQTDGKYKIITIKSIDEEGNEKVEVKKVKTSEKKIIIVSEEDGKEKKKEEKKKGKKKNKSKK